MIVFILQIGGEGLHWKEVFLHLGSHVPAEGPETEAGGGV